MNLADILSYSGKIGDWISQGVQKLIGFLSKVGIEATVLQTKILLILSYLAIIFAMIKFVNLARPIIKWTIIVLVGILALSTIISLF